MSESNSGSGSPLGALSSYPTSYDPALLYPVSRATNRLDFGLNADDMQLPFYGCDLWTAYELSWLNDKGIPQVAIGEFSVPCSSHYIIESKSLKLYLNSLNQTRFKSVKSVTEAIVGDLSACCNAEVGVKLFALAEYGSDGFARISGECIDQCALKDPDFELRPELLKGEGAQEVEECLYSDLLKTNCPVTGQPDWASLVIAYRGPRISRSGLLAYILSFRNHQDFHEHCVERVFMDIKRRLTPAELTVYARYTRRGGLDINPCRSTSIDSANLMIRSCGRLARQ